MAATHPRRLTAVLALLLAATVALLVPGAPAQADPEGGTKELRSALDSAAKGYADAKKRLAAAKKRQADLQVTLKRAQDGAASLEGEVADLASRSYRLGRLNTTRLLLNAADADDFVERAGRLDQITQVQARTLADYRADVTTAQQAKKGIDDAVADQQKQVQAMAKKVKEAELALADAGGGGAAGGFGSGSGSAPRFPGSGGGGCSENDPTTSGCVTPRLLHAYNAARSAGYKRYTSCFSQRSSGEHPKGRACDFSSAENTFKNSDAQGDDRAYGNGLAAYLVRNADRLGVMYVIWYRQIWINGGWRSYSGRGGASAEHTNHVHLSVL